MHTQFQAFIDALITGTEAEALIIMDNFLGQFGRESFQTLVADTALMTQNSVFEARSSLLCVAILKKYTTLARNLIEAGIDIEYGLFDATDEYWDQLSPLLFACTLNDLELIQYLLQAGANILHTNTKGMNALMLNITGDICVSLVEEAKKRRCLQQLADHKSNVGGTVTEYLKVNDNFEAWHYLMGSEFNEIIDYFELSENDALQRIERFITIYGYSAISELLRLSANPEEMTFLYAASRNNYLNVANRLLDLDQSSIDQGIFCELSDPVHHLASPLGIACYKGHTEMMRLLLSRGANLLHVDNDGQSLLMFARSIDGIKLLIEESARQNRLYDIIQLTTKSGFDAFRFHSTLGHSNLLLELLKIPYYYRFISINDLLNSARNSSIKYPEKSHEFDKICQQLRPFKFRFPALERQALASVPRLSDCYYSLFGDKTKLNQDALQNDYNQSRTEAVKTAIASFYSILISPAQCMQYLQFLNTELCRYFKHKNGGEFPVLDRSHLQFTQIEDLYYPVPGPGYQKINKTHALTELLLSIFKQHGLSEYIIKWIGFVSPEEAEKHVRNGYFTVDGTYGFGPMHGKLSHMLQRVILIYAVECGDINLSFDFNGTKQTLHILDILKGLVDLKTKDDKIVWGYVMDVHVANYIEYCDPFRLLSFIMKEGRTTGCRALSDSLTDSFCKSFIAYHETYRAHTPFPELDVAEFIRHLDDLTLTSSSPRPALIRAEVQKAIKKGQINITEPPDAETYAMTSKCLHPDADFIPETYTTQPETSYTSFFP